jgi:hypothetical protein
MLDHEQILMIVIRSTGRAQIEKSKYAIYTERAFAAQVATFAQRGNSPVF